MSLKSSHLPAVTPAKDLINNVIRETILAVEQELLGLPREGDKVELLSTTVRQGPPGSKRTSDWVKKMPHHSICTSASDGGSETAIAEPMEAPKDKRNKVKATQPKTPSEGIKSVLDNPNTQIVPGSAKVIPTKDGVLVELSVRVLTQTGSRLMEMTIYCPQYQPKSIYFDGKWRDVV